MNALSLTTTKCVVAILSVLAAGCPTTRPTTEASRCGKSSDAQQACIRLGSALRTCGDNEFCRALIEARLELLQETSRDSRFDSRARRSIRARTVAAVADLKPYLAQRASARKTAICRRHFDGTITCLQISKLLAFYDANSAEALLGDIDHLVSKVPALADADNVLIACGDGDNSWVDLSVQYTSARDLRWLMASQTDIVATLCAADQAIDFSSQHGGLDGFSGISGIPSAGLHAICGTIDLSTTSTMRAMEDMLKAAAAMHSCRASGDQPIRSAPPGPESFMEGDGSDAGSGGTGGTAQEPKVIKDAEGNVIGVEYVDSSTGETVRIDFTKDGPVVSATSADGKTHVTTAPDGSTDVQVDVDEGRSQTHHFDSGGAYQGYTDELRTKNGDVEVTKRNHFDEEHKLVESEAFQINSRTGEYLYKNDDTFISGPYNPEIWRRGPDGRWRRDYGGPIDCIDETSCQRCEAADALMAETLGKCADLGSRSTSCNAYRNAFSCCTELGSTVNPALIIPNPMGEPICHTDDVDVVAVGCEQRCKVASEPDCEANCARQVRPDLEYSFIDRACLYMYSEDCFGPDPQMHSGQSAVATETIEQVDSRGSVLPIERIDRPCTGLGCVLLRDPTTTSPRRDR